MSVFANSVTVELENDMLYGSDNKYTHGTKITYEYNDLNWSIAQNMYTPSDLDIDTPLTNDRPYAGILYVSLSGTKQWDWVNDTYHDLEIAVGTSGKSSGAGGTQKLIHEWTDSREPMGWDYQTEDKLLLQINGKINGEMFSTKHLNSRAYIGAEYGTIFANSGIGLNLTGGYNVPHNIDKPIMSKEENFSFYVFGDYYYRNIFWNKLLESEYTDVEYEHFILDLRAGIGVIYKGVELRYTQTHRSKEFTTQEEEAKFGTLTIKIDI